MAGTRAILGFVSILILAGGIVLELFVVLSGGINGSPINKVYFLQASTDGVSNGRPNIPNPARWTFFSVTDDTGAKWLGPKPALPFDPPGNFRTKMGLPDQFNSNTYYYLSRVAFAMFLIALFFAVCALLLSIFALFARLGAYITALTAALAMFFQAVAAALMTAWAVKGRNAFRSNNQSAQIGTYGFAFTWAAFACFLICTVLFCMGGSAGKSESKRSSKFGQNRNSTRSARSGRSRGSFRDSESGRRVKDEYD